MFDDAKTSGKEPEDILAGVDTAPKAPQASPILPRPEPPVNLPGVAPSATATSSIPRPTPPRPPLVAPEAAKNGSMLLKVVGGIAAFVVVAGVVIGVWYWWNMRDRSFPATGALIDVPNNAVEEINAPLNTPIETITTTPVNTPTIPGVFEEGATVNGLPTEANVEEDTDGDGLTDEEEKGFLTNENKVDTDDDDLTDREEIRVYKTDPRNPDTDGDGYLDGSEVKNNYNPRGPGKLFQLP